MVPPVARITTFGFLPCAVLVWQFASSRTPSVNHNNPLFALIATAPVSWVTPARGSCRRLVLVLALVQVRELDWVQQVLDLVLGQDLLLADHLEDALAALVGLGRQLGRLLVADHGIERGHDADRGLHVVLELGLIDD